MKNNYLLFTGLILIASCTKVNHFGRGEIHTAEKKYASIRNFSSDRGIAQSTVDACFSNQPTEAKLLQEIRLLENNNVSGSKAIINGLDLSKFSPAQAEYLDKNKEWINTVNLDISGCQDVKCLFSKIYPNSSGLEGYLNYYFYLKMGYAISTVKDVPEVNLVNFNDLDILFSEDELKGFYYLSKALGPTFQKIPTLTRIHRMPKNTPMPKYPTACGIADGPLNRGFIVLTDDCLTKNAWPKIGGNFYPLATHELSHRLDYNILPNNAVFSQSKTWLDFSGWFIKENIDAATGKVTNQWDHAESTNPNLKNDGFTRDYTATSPVEDFADSVGFARFTPDEVKRLSPRKYEWITKNLFDGKSYSSTDLGDTYSRLLVDYAMNGIPSVVNSCVVNKQAYSYKLTPEQLNDYREYDPELVQCIFGGVNSAVLAGVRELKANELEACDYFAASESALKVKVLAGMSNFIKKDLNTNIEISLQLKALAEYISKVNEELDPREVFVSCQADAAPTDCYSKQVKSSLETISADYSANIPNQVISFQANYLKENSYVEVKSKIASLFGQIYAGSELKFKEAAVKKWKSCFENRAQNDIADTSELLLSPYSGGSQFIRKSLLNCLNRSADVELMSVLDKIGKKLSITISNSATKKFILDMYIGNYNSTLETYVTIEAEREAKKAQEGQAAIKAKLYNDLTTNTSWVGSSANANGGVAALCEDRARKIIDSELGTSRADISNLYFHSPKNDNWAEQSCKSIVESNKVRGVVEANQSAIIKKSIGKLSNIFMKISESSMKKCKAQFSKNNVLAVKSRNLCLTNPLTWNPNVDAAVDAWLDEDNLAYIPTARRAGHDYLDGKKTELKDLAIKKMNN